MRGFVRVFALAVGIAAAPASSLAADCTLGLLGELPVTMSSERAPMVPVKINGVDARLIADSGSFSNLLATPAAKRLRLETNGDIHGLAIESVTGAEYAQVAKAKTFELFGVTFHDAEFIVSGSTLDAWADGLLGENILGVYDTEFDLADGVIRIFKPNGCGDSELAYWAGERPVSMLAIDAINQDSEAIEGHVVVNGVKLRAQFDTGSPRTVLTRRAARLVGINLDDPNVKPGGVSSGIGHGEFQTWIAPVASFEVGNEQVKNTHLRVGDIKLDTEDMLIGADFFLSHRVFVAKSQSRLYFTYNGGPVFNLEQVGVAAAPAAPASPADAPKDADGLSRRAAAFAARGQYDSAIADYTRAIAMSPADPTPLMDRADVYWRKDQPALAAADFTAALKLKPDAARALLERGELRLTHGDGAGAAADFDATIKLNGHDGLEIAEDYTSAGDYAEAIARFDAWIDAYPKSTVMASALDNRCWTRALWGKELDKAQADCESALRLSPGDPSILDSRGLVRLRLGDLDGAIADYSAALRSTKKDPWSLYGRGVARLRKGLKEDGAADLAAAAAIDPSVPERARKLGIAP